MLAIYHWDTDVALVYSFHTLMFHSTLILGVAVLFIVENPLANAVRPSPEDNPSAAEISLAFFILNAKWTTGIGISITVASLSCLATLSRSLDKTGSLKIDNRYLRLLPRLGFIAVAITLPLDYSMNGVEYLGIVVGVLSIVLIWEWWASLESDGGIFEP